MATNPSALVDEIARTVLRKKGEIPGNTLLSFRHTPGTKTFIKGNRCVALYNIKIKNLIKN